MILVTGANGFLGSRLIQSLSQNYQSVRALTRKIDRVPDKLKLKNVEWIQADILDVVAIEELMQAVEKVYHCAAKVSFESRHHERMMQVNVTGTANVVNAALSAGVKKLLHVSSTAALGRSDSNAFINEDNVWKNTKSNSVYAQSKFLAEREVWRGSQEGLTSVIVNPSVIIGPGNWKRGTPRLFYSCKRGMPIYPKGTNSFVFLDDVVNCMVRLMESDAQGERFIITSENVSYRNFFSWITETLSVKQPSIPLPSSFANVGWIVSSLLYKTLGIYPILTRETARTVNGVYHYQNKKIIERLNYQFKPAKEFVIETALQFKKDFYQVV